MIKLNVNEMGFNNMMEQMYRVLYGQADTDSSVTTTSILTFPKEILEESATAYGYPSSVAIVDWGYFIATAPDPTIADSKEKRSNSQFYAPVIAAVIEITHNINVTVSQLMIKGVTIPMVTFSVLKRGGEEILPVSHSVEIKTVNIKSVLLNQAQNRLLLTFSYEFLTLTNFISDKNSVQQGMIKTTWNKVTGASSAAA